ncbi:hypothetical protein NQZ68_040759 [Dissostichus eleginoides]|nr:hypothetical protein NQZ68_040759 [Dissostichus eleginoides]
MPKKPQVRATNHAHAALAQLGERVWPGMWKIQVRVTARVWTGTTTLVSVLEDGLNNYSGFSSKRISLSPFTKDFRGEAHLRVKPVFGRLGRLAERSEFVKDKTRLGLGSTQLHSASVTPGQKSRTKTGGDCATSPSPAANVKGKYELDGSEAGDSCNDKGHGVAVPASEPANAAHRPLLTLGLKD